MNIRTRLSVVFSIISSTIFIVFGVTIYLFAANYQKQDFSERLKERLVITEKLFLEKETFSVKELEKINNQFLHTLPQETEEVLLIEKDQTPIFKYSYPDGVERDFLTNTTFDFENGNLQGSTRIFRVNNHDYLVIVMAVDEVGLQNLSFLKKIIVFLILVGIPLIFSGSFLMIKRALLPIFKKIDKANSISASNLHQRLNVENPNDELGKMAVAFNKLLDRLEASFDAQKSFIRNASHEIRNPLTTIMGEAEVTLSNSRTNDEYKTALKAILSEAEILNSTVDNLLQLSKVEADEAKVNYSSIPIVDFMEDIINSYNYQNPSNKLRLNVSRINGVAKINGNKGLLKTGITNLIDNACKFSSNQEVNLDLKVNEGYLILSIKDTGIGIPTDEIDKITTPFYRANNVIQIKGSGIGLSLSAKIIYLHDGDISIQSELDSGTEVVLKFPRDMS